MIVENIKVGIETHTKVLVLPTVQYYNKHITVKNSTFLFFHSLVNSL